MLKLVWTMTPRLTCTASRLVRTSNDPPSSFRTESFNLSVPRSSSFILLFWRKAVTIARPPSSPNPFVHAKNTCSSVFFWNKGQLWTLVYDRYWSKTSVPLDVKRMFCNGTGGYIGGLCFWQYDIVWYLRKC